MTRRRIHAPNKGKFKRFNPGHEQVNQAVAEFLKKGGKIEKIDIMRPDDGNGEYQSAGGDVPGVWL